MSGLLLAGAGMGQPDTPSEPYVLKDINPEGSSDPGGFVTHGGVTYLRANGVHGAELWRTDGTDAGTALVSDINPGSLSSAPFEMTAFQGRLYFAATTAEHGREVWSSDGTAESTTLLRNINPAGSSADPALFLPVRGTLFFRAGDSAGLELWRTDGTPTGTALIKDIHPGSEGSIPTFPVALNGTVYFSADDAFTPGIGFDRELWRTDGTEAGTVRVKDINPGPAPSIPAALTRLSDRILFAAGDAELGGELWITDGTDAGTLRLKDINPGAASSFPTNLDRIGQHVYFAANDGTSGRELWRSDGMPEGTTLVKDINPGSADSQPLYPTAFQDGFLFNADDGEHGRELWFSDGTDAGTRLVKDINPGPANSSPLALTVAGDAVYFATVKASGAGDNTVLTELWKSDGTEAGTQVVWQAPGRSNGYTIRELDFSRRHLFFAAPTNIDANGLSADIEPYAIEIRPPVERNGVTGPAPPHTPPSP